MKQLPQQEHLQSIKREPTSNSSITGLNAKTQNILGLRILRLNHRKKTVISTPIMPKPQICQNILQMKNDKTSCDAPVGIPLQNLFSAKYVDLMNEIKTHGLKIEMLQENGKDESCTRETLRRFSWSETSSWNQTKKL